MGTQDLIVGQGLAATKFLDDDGYVSKPWMTFLSGFVSDFNDANYQNIYEVYRGTFTSNSPAAGYVAWADMRIRYHGARVRVASGNSNKEWIYWNSLTPTVLNGSDTFPALSDSIVLVARNESGTIKELWRDAEAIERVYLALAADGTVNGDKVLELSLIDDAATSDKVADANIDTYHFGVDAITFSLSGSWDIADLTLDGAWHELDVSSSVPAGMKTVFFHVRLKANALYADFHMRDYGSASGPDVAQGFTALYAGGSIYLHAFFVVNCGDDRIIEYLGTSGGAWNIIDIHPLTALP